MAISLKSLSSGAVFWLQNSAIIGTTSGFISSGTFVTAVDITEECLVSTIAVSIDTECDAEIRITRDGQVFLQETFLRDSLSNQVFTLVGSNVPLYCKESFKVEIRRVAGTGFTSTNTSHTTGSYQPIF